MRVADMMAAEGRVFLKSEWGPVSDRWPCVSFTKMSVGTFLQQETRPGRDIILYVGTTNPETTQDPAHRSAILSAVSVEPRHILETKRIVPPEVWAETLLNYGNRWPRSVAITQAADVTGYPSARDVCPEVYTSLGQYRNRGKVVEVTGAERDALVGLSVSPLDLNLSPSVRAFLDLGTATKAPREIGQEAHRMAMGIIDRVNKGGEPRTSINPLRTAPELSTLYVMLEGKWRSQGGCCMLCGGPLVAGAVNPMLKASADRIDSANGSYAADNVQITHVACNWAKNKYSTAQFEEWVTVLRGGGPDGSVKAQVAAGSAVVGGGVSVHG